MASNLLNGFLNKRLNEVIFPGAHDAGTFSATLGDNVRTQGVDVGAQAALGCRYFDVRVATRKIGSGANATLVKTTFHAPSLKDKSKASQKLGIGGDWGDSLDNILNQALAFVTNGTTSTEFIILRFSKSADYPGIINACKQILGNKLYKTAGNLGETKLSVLAGHVITVYANSGSDSVPLNFTTAIDGVIRIREMYKENGTHQVYDPGFDGFQYFGKHSDTKKLATHQERQKSRMTARVHQDAVGMMYWTLTGVAFKGSILSRMEALWRNAPLRNTWHNGLSEAIKLRLGNMNSIELVNAVSSQNFKAFMPNIIMVDNVDAEKCDTIFDLNAVASQQLATIFQSELDKRTREAQEKTGINL